jgi:hypothetical protein
MIGLGITSTSLPGSSYLPVPHIKQFHHLRTDVLLLNLVSARNAPTIASAASTSETKSANLEFIRETATAFKQYSLLS